MFEIDASAKKRRQEEERLEKERQKARMIHKSQADEVKNELEKLIQIADKHNVRKQSEMVTGMDEDEDASQSSHRSRKKRKESSARKSKKEKEGKLKHDSSKESLEKQEPEPDNKEQEEAEESAENPLLAKFAKASNKKEKDK